jgi:hypothetical protein
MHATAGLGSARAASERSARSAVTARITAAGPASAVGAPPFDITAAPVRATTSPVATPIAAMPMIANALVAARIAATRIGATRTAATRVTAAFVAGIFGADAVMATAERRTPRQAVRVERPALGMHPR